MNKFFAAAVLILAYIPAVMLHKVDFDDWFNPIQIILYWLYFPAVFFAVVLFGVGVWKCFDRRTLLSGLLLCLLASPLPALSIYGIRENKRQQSVRGWDSYARYVSDLLMDYHAKRPEAFHYYGGDEEVEVDGFADYVRSLGPHPFPGFLVSIRTKRSFVVDEFGTPLRFALDRNHDGYIQWAGQKLPTFYYEESALEYTIAVAVMAGPSDQHSLVPQVNRR